MNLFSRLVLFISCGFASLAVAEDLSEVKKSMLQKDPQPMQLLSAACSVQDSWLRRCLLDYAIALQANDAAALEQAQSILTDKAPDYDLARMNQIRQEPASGRRILAALALIDAEEARSGRRPSQMNIAAATPSDLQIQAPVAARVVAAAEPPSPPAEAPQDLNLSVKEWAHKLQAQDESVLPQLAAAAWQVKSRSLASALVKTSLLAKMRNAEQKTGYDAYLKQIQGRFMAKDLGRHLAFLQSEMLFEACASCNGGGKTEIKCKGNCKDGACTSSKCEGGEISYRGAGGDNIQKKCPVCQGASKCPRCQGTGKGEIPCGKCAGKGQRRSMVKVPEFYAASVTELVALAEEVAAKGYSAQDSRPDPVITAVKKPEIVQPAPVAKVETPAAAGSLIAKLQPKLVNRDGKKPEAKNLGKPKYVAYYFSASWCGPCRAFSPSLIAEYEALKKGGVQVILAGWDSDKRSMLGYMNTADHPQPWPGLCKQDQGDFGFAAYGISGIPAIVIVDANGVVVAKGHAASMLTKAKELAGK